MPELSQLRMIHIGCVVLSISGFMLRGALMLVDSPMLRRRWVRTVPHLVDSLLLLSGVWMAILIHRYPGTSPWLTAKLVALLGYIGLGMVALRLGRSKPIRIAALIGALACFTYIVAVAITRNPIPWA